MFGWSMVADSKQQVLRLVLQGDTGTQRLVIIMSNILEMKVEKTMGQNVKCWK